MAVTTPKLDENNRPDTQHPDYEKLKEKRDVVHAMMAGVDDLLENPATYLPQYEGETAQSYDLRQTTATFNPYTRKAVRVMGGMVFEEEIDISGVDTDIQVLCENIDKEGNHLNIFARRAFEQGVLTDGYGAIVVDTPSTVVGSKREQNKLDVNPFARFYCADSIWNWRYRINPTSKAKELEMIDFQEITQEKVGRFGVTEVTRYRVYELTDSGQVTLQTWKLNTDTGDPEPEGDAKILNTTEIAIPILGELGAEPPLYDIAKKNGEHFQLWSLLKSDAQKTCVPQRVIEGGSPDSIAPIGGDVTLFPPAGMKAYFIEVAGSSLQFVLSLCEKIADDIGLMASSIISGKAKTFEKTATEDVIDHAEETAELKPMAESFKDTLERMIGFFAELMNKGKDAGGTIVLGTQWAVAERKQLEAEARKIKADEANIKVLEAKAQV